MPVFRSIYVSVLLILAISQFSAAQELDYETIFGADWQKAEEFERENRHWMEAMLNQYDIPYYFGVSVIFPELVRYSAIKDKMETTLLKTLYVNLGEEYANFSIGRFQVKPSFASYIRTESSLCLGRRSEVRFSQPYEFDDISNYRKSIVTDLEDPKTQFNYIVAFFMICRKKFRTPGMDEEERLRFLSTAYNYGIDKTKEQILSMMDKKFFSTKMVKSITYCYSDISLYWYRKKTGYPKSHHKLLLIR